MSTTYDALIVGSGATGGWAAKELTERGLRVLLLEAGPRLAPQEIVRGRETDPQATRLLMERRPIQGRNRLFQAHNCHLYVDDVDHPYETPGDAPFNWIRSRQIGGRTLVWNRISLRLSDRELNPPESGEQSEAAWPLRFKDLESHYARVEHFIGVRGVRDGLPYLPDGDFLPPAREWEPAVHNLARLLAERLPNRRMIRTRSIEHAGPAARHDNGFPTASSPGSTLAAALKTDRLTLRPDAIVSNVLIDPHTGRASGVSFLDRGEGTRHEAHARVVILAASTVETVRILLNSSDARHPDGVGNSSGTLGCYVMDHLAGPSIRAVGAPVGSNGAIFYIPHFRSDEEARGARFRGGYGLEGELVPYGPRQGLGLSLMGEVLPRRENRIRLSPTRRDPWGIPVPFIDVRYAENEFTLARDASLAMTEIATALGFRVVERNDVLLEPGTRAHELGGARMGRDPRTSVTNDFGRCWDVPNLFLIDGAVFPTAGYQHPTLTMMAFADRASQFIATELGRGL